MKGYKAYVIVIHNWTANKRVAFGYTDEGKSIMYRNAISKVLFGNQSLSEGTTPNGNKASITRIPFTSKEEAETMYVDTWF